MKPTKAKLALALGVTRGILNRWERDDRAPVTEALAMPLDDGVELLKAWRCNAKRPPPGKRSTADGCLRERLLRAQCERTEEQARAERLENDLTEGRTVDRDDAVLEVAELVGAIRQEIESWPESVRADLPHESCDSVVGILAGKVHLLLTRLSQTKLQSMRVVSEIEANGRANEAT